MQSQYLIAVRSTDPEIFDNLITTGKRILARPPYCCLIRGIPVEVGRTILVALSAALGRIAEPYGSEWSRVVREIRPRNDRGSTHSGVLNEHMHTDGTDWEKPNDLTCLFCVRNDEAEGGLSRLISIDEIEARLADGPDGRALHKWLSTTPVPWKLAEEFGGRVLHAPILSESGIRWLKFTIHASGDRAVTDRAWAERLLAFEELLDHRMDATEFPLEPGDCLIVDNRKCLHARTPIVDASSSQRLLYRTKVVYR
ncbi:Taurine catabolism dioxygenase TauD, TfdA family [Bauldia litoralis]|uniref:Taurine catabolism dioxygenase TauD, TfdA family n=1 Tax=Bauldia litoralis TaxID=665467 RepID=A0A1G6EN70_9HYPH|nr:Taurine catabolism dioxygenase TauD, TfdA family [Bauldia litoralis]